MISLPTHLADTPAQNSFDTSHVDLCNHWSWGSWWESAKGTMNTWISSSERTNERRSCWTQHHRFNTFTRKLLRGKTADVFLEETSVCPQDPPHHPYMLMPPCQWRHITITAPLPMTQCNTYIIHSPHPFSQVHSYLSSPPVPLCLCYSQLFTILWNVLQCPAPTE